MRNNARNLPAYAGIILLAVLLYGKTAGFEFLPTWDDSEYVLSNPAIRGLSLAHIRAMFSETILGNYAPVQMLSYAFDYGIWGLDPRGYHLTNMLLHGINGCLLFALLKRLTGQWWLSFLPALIFVVHPVNIENVAWVSERKTLLSAGFFFSAILGYLEFREKGKRGARLFSLLFFSLGLLSKATVVVLPVVLLSYEIFLRRDGRKFMVLIPYVILSIAGTLAAFWSHTGAGSIEGGIANAGNLFGVIYPTMLTVFWKYVAMYFVPVNLSGYYDTTLYRSFLDLPVLASLLSWAAVAGIVLLKGDGQVRFWFLWFWICLLPVSNIIPIPVYYADRYLYLPGIAFPIMLFLVIKRLDGVAKKLLWSRFLPGFTYALFVVMVSAYSVVSYSRVDVWRDELSFWEDTAKKSPGLYKVRLNLGVAYEKHWRFREAEREYRAALAIHPGEKAARNLGVLGAKKKLLRERLDR